MYNLSSVAMALSLFAIILIVVNTGFSLQSVLGESIEDSVDRVIESAGDERDNDNDERGSYDRISEDFLDGLSDDLNDEPSSVYLDFDEDSNTLSIGNGNEGNHITMVVIPNQATASFRSPGNIDPFSQWDTTVIPINIVPGP